MKISISSYKTKKSKDKKIENEKDKQKEKEIKSEFKKDSIKIEHQSNIEVGKDSNQSQKQKNFYIFYCSYGYIKVTLSDFKNNPNLLKFIQYREIPFYKSNKTKQKNEEKK